MATEEISTIGKVWNFISGFPAGLLAGIAAMSTIQWALQTGFGRPKIIISLEEGGDDNSGDLHCHVFNKPVYNKLLRALGVKREAITIFGSFDACKSEGARDLVVDQQEIYFYGDEDARTKRITLDTFLPTRFDVAHRSGAQTWLEQEKQTSMTYLDKNRYEITARLCYGNEMYMFKARFTSAEMLYWEPGSFQRIKLK